MHEHGTEKLAKRAASIEKRIARMKVTDRPKKDKKMSVSFGDPNYETEDVLKVRGITKSYDCLLYTSGRAQRSAGRSFRKHPDARSARA